MEFYETEFNELEFVESIKKESIDKLYKKLKKFDEAYEKLFICIEELQKTKEELDKLI